MTTRNIGVFVQVLILVTQILQVTRMIMLSEKEIEQSITNIIGRLSLGILNLQKMMMQPKEEAMQSTINIIGW